jgi:hypothetical protein
LLFFFVLLAHLATSFLLWSQTAMHPDYPFKDDLPRDFVPGKALPVPKPY